MQRISNIFYILHQIKIKKMKKLIEIDGSPKEKGTVFHTLNMLAAREGKDLTSYIRKVLKDHAKRCKI